MSYQYNDRYFDGTTIKQLRPKRDAIQTYILSDGVVIGMFQGSRGINPELDFIIRVLKPGNEETPEPPPHIYWVVDLLLKIESYRKEVREIIEYYIDFYDNCAPFTTIDERKDYKLQTVEHIMKTYGHVKQAHTGSLDYVAIIIELFSLNEKRNTGAFMFRNILSKFLDYIDGKVHFMNLLYFVEHAY